MTLKLKLEKTTLVVAVMLAAGCYTGMDDADVDALEREDEIQEIVDNLLAAGYPETEIGVLADGTVYVGSDALVSLDASREMAGLDKDGNPIEDFRQYRTNNLVGAGVSVICVNPTAAFAGNANLSAGLDLAISRYNAQNLGFTMQRNGAGCSANITANMDNSGGGVAGFPANGLPYTSITIGSTVGTYGVDVSSHVIAHELGHCIGFRHTDYFNRAISCGGGASNEGDGGVGAVHIPGTPTTDVTSSTSVMVSCYSLSSNGVFTPSDVTALQYLYGAGGFTPPTWSNVATFANQTAGAAVETQYGPFDATAYDAIRFQIAGGTGDADLYVRYGAAPTTATYDCRPYLAGNAESCTFDPSQNGNYYVMVRAYSAYSGVTLTVDGATAAPPPPPEDCDNGADDDGDGSIDCADSNCTADPACVAPPPPWTQLSSTTFESNWGIYTDGGIDCQRLSNASYAHAGSWSAEIRDDSGVASSFYSSAFNLSSYDDLRVDFWFYARSMETGENFFVELWNGSSWVVIANAVRGTDFNNNVLYNAVIEVDDTQVNFSNAAQIRFRNDASADNDLINIDDVVISAR